MKPIKNVFPACEGSEKGYSVNRSESTLMLVGQKRDEDKTPAMPFYIVSISLQRRIIAVLLVIVVLANSKKNRNIKSNDVSLISAARSTDFCFKTTYVGMFLCFRSIVRCFQCFVCASVTLWKTVSHEPPLPLGNYCL